MNFTSFWLRQMLTWLARALHNKNDLNVDIKVWPTDLTKEKVFPEWGAARAMQFIQTPGKNI